MMSVQLLPNVDGDVKSYIVVDYKNLKLLRNREKQTLDALSALPVGKNRPDKIMN